MGLSPTTAGRESRATSYMGPSSIAVTMTEEKDRYWLYCNYCGESLPLGRGAYNHVVENHGAEVHVGPGEFDPGRRKRSMTIFLVGIGLILPTFAAIALLFGNRFDGTTGSLYTATFIGLIVGTFIYSELYARKGVKSDGEILMDLDTVCDTCGARVSYRDSFHHTEVYHPEEYSFDRRVYEPFGIAFICLVVGSIAGMLVSFFLGDWDGFSRDETILLVVSLSILVTALVVGYLFEKLFHLPRTKRLAEEWAKKHPSSKK